MAFLEGGRKIQISGRKIRHFRLNPALPDILPNFKKKSDKENVSLGYGDLPYLRASVGHRVLLVHLADHQYRRPLHHRPRHDKSRGIHTKKPRGAILENFLNILNEK